MMARIYGRAVHCCVPCPHDSAGRRAGGSSTECMSTVIGEEVVYLWLGGTILSSTMNT